MKEQLTAVMGVFWINTVCTLRCKRCITLTPYHKAPKNFPISDICREIDGFFEVYDATDHLDIEGGESLLHPELDEIIRKAQEYRARFQRLHILTNGTVLPDQKLLDCCAQYDNILFIIDHYGELSAKAGELKALLESRQIPFRVDQYHGDEQYYGGWVSFGDMKFKGYTQDQLHKVFENCLSAHCKAPYVREGKIFLCNKQACQIDAIELVDGEYVNLLDQSVSHQQKREIALGFGQKPIEACKYCLGFDAKNGERFPAAEQLPLNIPKEMKIC